MWALDIAQVAQFSRNQFKLETLVIDADNDFGWPTLLAGAALPQLLPSGTVRIRHASLHDDIRARRDAALADVPGILERLDIRQIRKLWPGGQVHVKSE
jgi:hypothetical protein